MGRECKFLVSRPSPIIQMTVHSGIPGEVCILKTHTNDQRFNNIKSFHGNDILCPLRLYKEADGIVNDLQKVIVILITLV